MNVVSEDFDADKNNSDMVDSLYNTMINGAKSLYDGIDQINIDRIGVRYGKSREPALRLYGSSFGLTGPYARMSILLIPSGKGFAGAYSKNGFYIVLPILFPSKDGESYGPAALRSALATIYRGDLERVLRHELTHAVQDQKGWLDKTKKQPPRSTPDGERRYYNLPEETDAYFHEATVNMFKAIRHIEDGSMSRDEAMEAYDIPHDFSQYIRDLGQFDNKHFRAFFHLLPDKRKRFIKRAYQIHKRLMEMPNENGNKK